MALTAVSIYSPSGSLQSIALVAAVFGMVNLPSVSTWTVLGQQLRHVLSSALRMRVFNVLMASLLLASLYPVLVNS